MAPLVPHCPRPAVSFLGLGVQPPIPSWGAVLSGGPGPGQGRPRCLSRRRRLGAGGSRGAASPVRASGEAGIVSSEVHLHLRLPVPGEGAVVNGTP